MNADRDSIKETAEFFRYGLMLGIHIAIDAIAWLDTVLIADPAPDIALIEASLCGSRGPVAVADWLKQVPGKFDRKMVARRLCSEMFVLLRKDRTQAPVVAHWLYQMALDDFAPDKEAEQEMWYFDDALILARGGMYGDVAEINDELERFLSHYRPGL